MVQSGSGDRAIFKTVSTGGSFGASPLRQEIGLGDAKAIRRVEVSWPASGRIQAIENLALDQVYQIREGEPEAALLKLKRFKFAVGPIKPLP